MRNRWPILALLCVLASLLVPGIASAHSAAGAQSRVWAFDLAEQVHVGGQRALTPELHQGCELAEYDFASGSLLAAKGGRALRRVGDLLESTYDVLANPKLLAGKHPKQVESILGKTPGWRIETLGKGSRKGKGWVLREYTPKGDPTGRSMRWHPGGGHHGPGPYWRVTGGADGKSGIIR